ncbi:MAG: pirin family protein [Deltaproteobacteria bacterium]|nr:pirin family protein [Deltaproteobacteria bacterium]
MGQTRHVVSVEASRPTVEGAGVSLRRVFGRVDTSLDPFLLLDDFGSDDPADYLAGFPWHPHRGFETITYMLEGAVAHGDSLGNKGTIGPGDVQWMTAGSGIIHEEMPKRSPRLHGFQLWANLPASNKMMDPRYQDVPAATIPTAELADGVEAKVICGLVGGVTGPVSDIVTDPEYLDVTATAGSSLIHPIPPGYNAFAYLVDGEARFNASGDMVGTRRLVVFGDGSEVGIAAGEDGARFLLVSGRPIREPVAWRGPIVMNNDDELRVAFEEYSRGTFIKRER